MTPQKCLAWVKEFGGKNPPFEKTTSMHVVDWLADKAKEACLTQEEEILCDETKSVHQQFLAALK